MGVGGELSKRMAKLLILLRVDLVPSSRSSVLFLCSLKKLEVKQDFVERRQPVREAGLRVERGLEEMYSWVSST